jgi:carbon-monoxide dehydrogenase large subunit
MIQSFLFAPGADRHLRRADGVLPQPRRVYTNTTQVDAYRGAGRPEAIYVLERVMDRAARELGSIRWICGAINFIKPDQFPYKTATGELYDVGDFGKVLAHGEGEADLAGFARRKAASRPRASCAASGCATTSNRSSGPART